MATSYEKRHEPDELSFHKRPSGGPASLVGDFLLLEDDTGAQTEAVLLESDTGAGVDGLKLEDSV
jgi:hypothetical protein